MITSLKKTLMKIFKSGLMLWKQMLTLGMMIGLKGRIKVKEKYKSYLKGFSEAAFITCGLGMIVISIVSIYYVL